MRASPRPLLLIVALAACSDGPTAPEMDATSLLPSESLLAASSETFSLRMGSSADAPTEGWGVMFLRVGLAPPNPCYPFGRTRILALSVCAVIVNPAFERIDAMTFEVTTPSGVEVLRGFVNAPPNPCNIAVVTGILPADLAGATGVTATVETDAGVLVSTPPSDWPGGAAAPPNPCTLTVTLG